MHYNVKLSKQVATPEAYLPFQQRGLVTAVLQHSEDIRREEGRPLGVVSAAWMWGQQI